MLVEYTLRTTTELDDFNAAIEAGEVTDVKLEDFDVITFKHGSDDARLNISPEHLTKIDYQQDDITDLIYGKCPQQNIVSVHHKEDNIHIFLEKNEEISEYVIPYKPWVLSNVYGAKYEKLKGSTHYKYIRHFDDLADLERNKKDIYKYKLYRITNLAEQFLTISGMTYFKNMTPTEVSTLSFDIETSGVNPYAENAKVFIITNTFRKSVDKLIRKTFNLKDYNDDDVVMIADWCKWVREINPTLLLGHNIVMFDFPYLFERSNGSLPLGRDGSDLVIESFTREIRKDGSQSYSYNRKIVFGREIIDTFFLAIKYDIGRKYESYGLKAIIRHEGKEKDDRTFVDTTKIGEYYRDEDESNWLLTLKYAEEDSDDALMLYDLMISSFFYSNQMVPKSFQQMLESASGSQLNSLMVRSYIQKGFSVAKSDDVVPFEGGLTIGIPGVYKNVIGFDTASLYPSVIIEFSIENKVKDYNGNFLKVVRYLRSARLKNKKLAKDTGIRYYDDLQNSQKTNINSLFGLLSTSGLNFNYPQGAAEITRNGREILNKGVEWATSKHSSYWQSLVEKSHDVNIVNPSIDGHDFILANCDTDAIKFCKKDMSPFSAEEAELLRKELNSLFPETISWEDDGVYQVFCVLKAKNYIMYDGKKIKLKGSSLKASQKESILREMSSEMIENIVHNNCDNLVTIYESYIKKALNPTDIKQWCQKKTITKAVLNCESDPNARKNESVVWDAIKYTSFQEGDKVYVYPAILGYDEESKIDKKGVIKVKKTAIEGLKLANEWTNDHNTDKLVARVYSTLEILSTVIDMTRFIDYTLVKNKALLEALRG